jgi:Lon protease-like protein
MADASGPGDAEREVIPIFPLGQVLMPGMPLPLHIFEPRYRQLLADVTANGHRRFGVVCLTRGSEVGVDRPGGEPEFAQVGTVAEVMEARRLDDGAADLLTVGSRRFRILSAVGGKPYRQAVVRYLAELDGELPAGLLTAVRTLQHEHERLIRGLTGRRPTERPPTGPNPFSYHLAAGLPLAPPDRQLLLEEETAASRLRRTRGLLQREIAYLRATRTIAVSPRVLQLHVRPN